MTKNKNILIISYSPLHRDPRILRQIEALKDEYKIQTVGWTNPNVKDVDFFEVSMPTACKTFCQKVLKGFKILFHFYNSYLLNTLFINQLFSYNYVEPNAIFANDWNGLYAAKVLIKKKKWNCKIYFDSHEYFPLYRESFKWKILEKPIIKYVLKVSKKYISIMSCVCPTLSKMYEDFFGFEKGFVRVITNSPKFETELQPSGIGDKIRLIHHGAALRSRNIETMIDMMSFLSKDKYELNFMLVDNEPNYYEELKKRAKKYENIHFLEPVPFSKIPSFINQFDIGVFILNNDIITYKYALPNKFFEFVQARLAIAVGDSPEMRNYIEKYQLGVSSKSNIPEELAKEIMTLSNEDLKKFKSHSDQYAFELSAEKNIVELKKIANELTY